MPLTTQEVSKLRRIIRLAENLIQKSGKRSVVASNGKLETKVRKRIRRTGQELVQFQQMLKAERKKGISVSEMARKHGISTAYIYMLR